MVRCVTGTPIAVKKPTTSAVPTIRANLRDPPLPRTRAFPGTCLPQEFRLEFGATSWNGTSRTAFALM
jgi:hypothetical protein